MKCLFLLSFLTSMTTYAQGTGDPLDLNQTPSLYFQQNAGQIKDHSAQPADYVLFKLETRNLNVWVTNTGLTYQFFQIEETEKEEGDPGDHPRARSKKTIRTQRIDMILKNATINKENIVTYAPVEEHTENYYLGHCPEGVLNVKSYDEILITGVYPGVDWHLKIGSNGNFKHEFIVHPGADPKQIELTYEGDGEFEPNENHIYFTTDFGSVREGDLVCFQDTKTVNANYQFEENTTLTNAGAGNQNEAKQNQPQDDLFSYDVQIQVGTYDRSQELVIDPELVWGTFYGGINYEGVLSITLDSDNNLFATGYNASADFPVLDAGTYYQTESVLNSNTFVLKFTNGGVLLWATHFGGTGLETGEAITVDVNNDVWLTGRTGSTDLPTLEIIGDYYDGDLSGDEDVFITKFANDGTLLLSTYYGGENYDRADAIDTDPAGNVYITGWTKSSDFPTFDNGGYFDASYSGGFEDIFILKFNESFDLEWSTYYGGNNLDKAYEIEVDAAGNIWVAGKTRSTDFETEDLGGYFDTSLGGVEDAFLLKFDPDGNQLWSTYFGGSAADLGVSLISDSENNIFFSGQTSSTDFPILDAGTYIQATHAGGKDAFITKFDGDGNQLWGTYYGGSHNEGVINGFEDTPTQLDIDACDNVYFTFDTYHNTGEQDIPIHDPGACSFFEVTTGGIHIFLARFQNDGTLDYANHISRSFRGSLILDDDDQVFFGCESKYFEESLPYIVDPGDGAYVEIGNGSEDLIFFKLVDTLQTTLTVESEDLCGCTNEISITACGIPPYSFEWSNGVEFIDTVINHTRIDTLCPGDKWVKVTSGCYHTDTVFFTIEGNNAGFVLDLGPDTVICRKEFILLNAENPGATYLWHDGSSDPFFTADTTGTYWVEVSDGEGCAISDTIHITVEDCIGIGIEEEDTDEIIVYPNPFHNYAIVDLGENFSAYDAVLIHNTLGQEVYRTTEITSKYLVIERKSLSAGRYTLSVIDKKGYAQHLQLLVE